MVGVLVRLIDINVSLQIAVNDNVSFEIYSSMIRHKLETLNGTPLIKVDRVKVVEDSFDGGDLCM